MPFRFLWAILLSAHSFGWPEMAKGQDPTANTKAKNTKQSEGAVPTHVIIDPPLPKIEFQSGSGNNQDKSVDSPLPRFIRPEWIIVYVTTIYVWITWRMLKAIKRQADLLDNQARHM